MTPAQGVRAALAAALLALGPLLLWLTPLPPPRAPSDWALPGNARLTAPDGYRAFKPVAPPTPHKQAVTLDHAGQALRFFRFSYVPERINQDLVPSFSRTYDEPWVKPAHLNNGGPAPDAIRLENRYNGERWVLAFRYRIGPWATSSFAAAKLLQVPAKLRGDALFEIITLAAPCTLDCDERAQQARDALEELLSLNRLERFDIGFG